MVDVLPANNTATSLVTVTGSYDPNDKLANTSHGNSSTVYLIDEDEWVDYTIRFQNTGTDTAFLVVVTDTLPQHLDPATIRMGAGSHAFSWSLSGQGTLRWVFPNIMLPDSNVNEAASHGFVSFRIRPHLPLLPGTAIENTANIFFDFNDPVITEPSVLTTEFSTGLGNTNGSPSEFMLQPNPASESVEVRSRKNIGSLRLLTADGRLVQQSRVGSCTAQLDLNGLANGTYVVELMMTDGSVVHEQLIKY